MSPLDRFEPIPRAATHATQLLEAPKLNVKMLETRSAAPDGATVVRLIKGETYDLPEDLACSYIDRGRAVLGETPVAAPPRPPVGDADTTKPATTPARRSRSRKAQ